jgi:hypothetical protein
VGSAHGSNVTQDTASALGVHVFETRNKLNTNHNFKSFGIASPIHTSSHYQTFETPFLHELVGGDRNMEQTNLVVTPDGKTWDEVTRDVSYMGSDVFVGSRDGGNVAAGNSWFSDYVRGQFKYQDCIQKDIAVAYDRLIFLKSGTYAVKWQPFYNAAGWSYVNLNSTGTEGARVRVNGSDFHGSKTVYYTVQRGDYLYIKADNGGTIDGSTNFFSTLSIERI